MTTPSPLAIEATGLVKTFDGTRAVDGVDLAESSGSVYAVMNAGFMGIFPLTFLSNVFVEPKTLPSVLEAFVDVTRSRSSPPPRGG
jgi:ABC-2 type transport system permease protein